MIYERFAPVKSKAFHELPYLPDKWQDPAEKDQQQKHEHPKPKSAFWRFCQQHFTTIQKRLNNKARSPHLVESISTHPKANQRHTLLNIPQELRDMIFAHAFNTADPNTPIDLRIIFFKNAHNEQGVRAGIPPLSAPPPPAKTPLLVCRQLHTEQKKTHAAAYRRYWTAQHFHITVDSPYMLARLRPVAEADLQHIRYLAIAPVPAVSRSRVNILVPFRFEAATASWRSSTIERSPKCEARLGEERPVPWHLTECARRDAFLRALEGLVERIRRENGGLGVVDPSVGRGLDAREIYELSAAVWGLILDSG